LITPFIQEGDSSFMAPRRKQTLPPVVPQALDQLLTIPQAARRLGISDSKFYRLMRDPQNGIPVLRMPGHTTRIPAAKLQLWVEQHTEQAS
jgi:excisionase family DNA binding protein